MNKEVKEVGREARGLGEEGSQANGNIISRMHSGLFLSAHGTTGVQAWVEWGGTLTGARTRGSQATQGPWLLLWGNGKLLAGSKQTTG